MNLEENGARLMYGIITEKVKKRLLLKLIEIMSLGFQ